MKILNSKDLVTSSDDDFLYVQLMRLLEQIKITQGGTELAYTLRNHKKLKNYAIAKQIQRIKLIEEKYFNEDGSLKEDVIQFYVNSQNKPLQNNKIRVN